LELGTEATRTGIIDNARKSGYIDLKKDVYTILPGGEFLIEALTQMQINMDKYKTSQLGQALKRVFRGSMTVGESVQLAEAEIREVFEKKADATFARESDTGFFGDVVATCPLCGRDMKRQRNFYGCSGYQDGCKFSVQISICSRVISITALKELTEHGRTPVISGFISPRTGKTFDAALKLENGRAVFDFAQSRPIRSTPGVQIMDGEQPPLPEPPPEY
jgi:DNA topoisomerase-3